MRIVGPVLFVLGVMLLVVGLNSSQSFTEKVAEDLTGRYTHDTMWYILGGIALIVAGGATYVVRRRK